MDTFSEHALNSGSIIMQATIESVEKTDYGFLLKSASKEYQTKFLLLATGNNHRHL
ncbi:MAG: hypothetical protein U9Q66_03120 [Patescibacteria group bacterium]|nr:hypothetical protein [Patescibacteria group bacterium]